MKFYACSLVLCFCTRLRLRGWLRTARFLLALRGQNPADWYPTEAHLHYWIRSVKSLGLRAPRHLPAGWYSPFSASPSSDGGASKGSAVVRALTDAEVAEMRALFAEDYIDDDYAHELAGPWAFP